MNVKAGRMSRVLVLSVCCATAHGWGRGSRAQALTEAAYWNISDKRPARKFVEYLGTVLPVHRSGASDAGRARAAADFSCPVGDGVCPHKSHCV